MNEATLPILQVEGLPGLSGLVPATVGGDGGDDTSSDKGGGPPNGTGPRSGGTLADNIVSSALRYRAQAPFIDKLLKEIGMSPSDITHIGNLLREEREAEGKPEEKKGKRRPRKLP